MTPKQRRPVQSKKRTWQKPPRGVVTEDAGLFGSPNQPSKKRQREFPLHSQAEDMSIDQDSDVFMSVRPGSTVDPALVPYAPSSSTSSSSTSQAVANRSIRMPIERPETPLIGRNADDPFSQLEFYDSSPPSPTLGRHSTGNQQTIINKRTKVSMQPLKLGTYPRLSEIDRKKTSTSFKG